MIQNEGAAGKHTRWCWFLCLGSCVPILQLFEVVNAGSLEGGSMQWAEFEQRLEQLSFFLLRRRDGSRMLNHASFREWLMWREEGQDERFLCDPR